MNNDMGKVIPFGRKINTKYYSSINNINNYSNASNSRNTQDFDRCLKEYYTMQAKFEHALFVSENAVQTFITPDTPVVLFIIDYDKRQVYQNDELFSHQPWGINTLAMFQTAKFKALDEIIKRDNENKNKVKRTIGFRTTSDSNEN